MGYMAGLARRYGKLLLPWMQAHGAASLTLGHPTPAVMDRMWAQHLPFNPAGMMWLGFDNNPKGNSTFPHGSPESWAHAKELFAKVHAEQKSKVEGLSTNSSLVTRHSSLTSGAVAPLAVVRPYATRAICCSLGDGRWRNPADRILEAFAMAWGVDNGLQYDVFELPPDPAELARYKVVVSTIPIPGVANVRVLGEGTEGTVVTSAELVAMRKAFAAEIAMVQNCHDEKPINDTMEKP
jgi:hypothetical protein